MRSKRVLDKLETSKTASLSRCTRSSLMLLESAAGHKRFVLVECHDRYKCEHCARKYYAKVRHKLNALIEGARAYPGDKYIYLLTFTINPRVSTRYGQTAMDNITSEINRFNAFLFRTVTRRILLKLRTIEYHKDGAIHAHMVLVSQEILPLRSLLVSGAYRLGFAQAVLCGRDDFGKVLGYVAKYGIKSSADVLPAQHRVAHARFFAASGVVARQARLTRPRCSKFKRLGWFSWKRLHKVAFIFSGGCSGQVSCQGSQVRDLLVSSGNWSFSASAIGPELRS